jgi:hypothetical protein
MESLDRVRLFSSFQCIFIRREYGDFNRINSRLMSYIRVQAYSVSCSKHYYYVSEMI